MLLIAAHGGWGSLRDPVPEAAECEGARTTARHAGAGDRSPSLCVPSAIRAGEPPCPGHATVLPVLRDSLQITKITDNSISVQATVFMLFPAKRAVQRPCTRLQPPYGQPSLTFTTGKYSTAPRLAASSHQIPTGCDRAEDRTQRGEGCKVPQDIF